MGFIYLHSFNLALVGKHGWNLVTKPDSLATFVLKAKYYPHSSFFEATLGYYPYRGVSRWLGAF